MQRYSRKREAIYKCLCSTTTHPTAEWIYAQLKPEYPDLSFATVYRNLGQMKQEGLVISVGIVDDKERFDANVMNHPHAVCRCCGKVVDICGMKVPEGMIDEAERLTSYSMLEINLQFTGICESCRKQQEEE